MLSEDKLDGLPELMEGLGLIPQNPIDQEPFPDGEDRPVAGAVDTLVVTGDHRIYNLETGCGITVPLREFTDEEDDALAEFADDSLVRIFDRLE